MGSWPARRCSPRGPAPAPPKGLSTGPGGSDGSRTYASRTLDGPAGRAEGRRPELRCPPVASPRRGNLWPPWRAKHPSSRDRLDPSRPARPRRQMAADLGGAETYRTDMDGSRPLLLPDDVPLSLAEKLHIGNGLRVHRGGHLRPLPPPEGDDVFEPLGFDAFGIHSENYALKVGEHPRDPDRPQTSSTSASSSSRSSVWVSTGPRDRHHQP